VVQLRIAVLGIEPPIWLEVLVPQRFNLENLKDFPD